MNKYFKKKIYILFFASDISVSVSSFKKEEK